MFSQSELLDLHHITSPARLSSYPRYLGTTNAAEAYGAYMWSMAVSTAFSPVIHAIEVGLRNSLNHELSIVYGPSWFELWVVKDGNESRGKGKIPANQKSTGEKLVKDAIMRITKRDHPAGAPAGYIPPWQRVLAELTFGFWVNFLVKRFYDVNHRAKLWPNHLVAVFPGAPPSMRGVGALHKEFEKIVEIRNRIHHHEPLWKDSAVTGPGDAIKNLRAHLASALTKLDYLGRGQRLALDRFGVIASIEELCTLEAFERYTGRSRGATKLYQTAKRDLKLYRKLPDRESIWVASQSGDVQLVIRNGNRRFF